MRRTLLVVFGLLAVPPFVALTARAAHLFPIGYNEGWNAFHADRVLAGEPLYLRLAPSGLPLTPVNYPPLSFLAIAALSGATGWPPLLVGRGLSALAAVALALLVAWLVHALTSDRVAAALGGLTWIGLLAALGSEYVAMNDPQLAAHVAAFGALAWHVHGRRTGSPPRPVALGFLAGVALLTKHLVLPAPLVLGADLGRRGSRHLFTYLVPVAALGSAGVAFAWWSAGPDLAGHALDLHRGFDARRLQGALRELAPFAGILVLPWFAAGRLPREGRVVLAHAALAWTAGLAARCGDGVWPNAYFDGLLASSALFGCALSGAAPAWQRLALPAAAVAALLPSTAAHLAPGARERLRAQEAGFASVVSDLRGAPGPVLVGDPLLAVAADKRLLFDPFAGTQLIVAGVVPEHGLVEAVEQGAFDRIVFRGDPLQGGAPPLPADGRPAATRSPHWTDAVLLAVERRYTRTFATGTFTVYARRTDAARAP